jgi:two-component system response regulator BaeR
VNRPAPLILIVEDEPRIAEVLRDYLVHAGYRAELEGNGAAAVERVRSLEPDLILLDLMLPGLDGLQVCRTVRSFSGVPIIMATARVEEIDRLLGLELGADDYICKPFSPREVVARVKAVLRRMGRNATESSGQHLFAVDEAAQRIGVQGVRLVLTQTEFRLLSLLVRHPGRVFSRTQLLDAIHEADADVFDRAIDSHIKNLRKKIAAVLGEREVIHSVYGAGYRFEP